MRFDSLFLLHEVTMFAIVLLSDGDQRSQHYISLILKLKSNDLKVAFFSRLLLRFAASSVGVFLHPQWIVLDEFL